MDIFIPLVLFPYVLAVLMPSWRWLAFCVLLVGGYLSYMWIDHWIASSKPGYKEGPGGAIGIGIFFAVTVGFGSGVLVRIVSLAVSASGNPRRAFTINAVGFLLPVAAFVVPPMWQAWRLRPAAGIPRH